MSPSTTTRPSTGSCARPKPTPSHAATAWWWTPPPRGWSSPCEPCGAAPQADRDSEVSRQRQRDHLHVELVEAREQLEHQAEEREPGHQEREHLGNAAKPG